MTTKDEFAGSVSLDNLYDIFGFYALMRKIVCVEIESLNRFGKVYMQGGDIIHCETNTGTVQEGEKAFLQILLWKSATFKVFPNMDANKSTIKMSYETLLIDTLTKIDEYNKSRITKPSYDSIMDEASFADLNDEKFDILPLLRTVKLSLQNIMVEIDKIIERQ